jgi:hypothetical protein
MTDSTVFIIDSSKRLPGGTDSDFHYQIQIPKIQSYSHACILDAIIPKSYYLVAAPNNIFNLIENGVTTLITVIPANYNVISWQTIMASLLTTNSSQGWTYTITYPDSKTQPDTGQFTYSVTGNGSLQPQISFPSNSTLYEQFGFPIASTNSFVANTLVSQNVLKFQQEDCLFLHSNLITTNTSDSTTDVLQAIMASSTPPFSNVVYSVGGAVEAKSHRLATSTDNVYSFTITDEKNNVLNLNGLNCVFTIVIYQKDMINQIIGKNIALNNNLSSHNL